jgi:hypothetical protein
VSFLAPTIIPPDVEAFIHQWWRPIETAPVPPREVLRYDIWPCLLQDAKGRVVGGFGAYARIQGKADRWRLKWYAGQSRHVGGFGAKVFEPTKWMPMPPPEIDT